MTLSEYFSSVQPISDEVVNGVFYRNVRTITFEAEKGRHAQIIVAHVGENLWSFGWEIQDGWRKPCHRRDCTTSNVSKGNIGRLIYGMTKVLLMQSKKIIGPSMKITMAIMNATKEAAKYCHEAGPNEKITI